MGRMRLLVALHFGAFRLFKCEGLIRAADATATAVGEERCRNGGRVCLYCGWVAPSQCCLSGIAAGCVRADDDRHARVDHANRANAGQKVAALISAASTSTS
jgi:hypothetical protein